MNCESPAPKGVGFPAHTRLNNLKRITGSSADNILRINDMFSDVNANKFFQQYPPNKEFAKLYKYLRKRGFSRQVSFRIMLASNAAIHGAFISPILFNPHAPFREKVFWGLMAATPALYSAYSRWSKKKSATIHRRIK